MQIIVSYRAGMLSTPHFFFFYINNLQPTDPANLPLGVGILLLLGFPETYKLLKRILLGKKVEKGLYHHCQSAGSGDYFIGPDLYTSIYVFHSSQIK